MKYLVMECHEGYAVLMDEASRFVHAANLRYEVGQTVTDPILMEDAKTHITRSAAVRVAAGAACLLMLSAAGFRYYLRSWKTESVVLMDSELKIEMQLNSRGQVINLSSATEDGQDLLKNYNAKRKPQLDVVNDLLQMQKDQGYLSDGDTVEFYITSESENDYETYKSELEQQIPKMQINVSVQEMDSYTPAVTTPAQEDPAPAAAPVPPAPADAEPPAPPHADGRGPAEGPGAHEPPAPPVHPDEDPKDPAEPGETPAEPPAPGNPPADPAATPVPPDADEHAEPPRPADDPAAADPPAPITPPTPAHHPEPAPPHQTPAEHPEPVEHPEPAEHPELTADTEVQPPEPEIRPLHSAEI